MEQFSEYGHALASMAGFALLLVVLSAMSVSGRSSDQRCDCGLVKRDYSNVVYRRGRAFMNAVETTGPFMLALGAAMLTGANPFWVNLLASLFLLARIAVAAVHIGTTNQSARSALWSVSILCVLGLAGLGFVSAF